MSTTPADYQRELAIEQAHVDKVYHHLARATASAKNLATTGREIFQSDRTNFLREEDGTALFERDAFAFQAAKRLATLDAEHEGLVFGRLDLTAPETRYIGRIGVRDDDYNPLVIDWRAPAAEPFYRATASNPMDVIRRRVLRCRDDVVVGIEDDLLDADAESDLVVIGEGALMASLKRARGRTMRDIVATIQAEQDEAIRAPYQGVTLIAGGPGTGKTVVALHRAAYLLYTNRRRLEAGGVLVVGPSSVFMNYIERVLPSLGEDSVTLKAIGSVASDVLGIRTERVDDAQAATLKGSLRMVPLLSALIREPLTSGDATMVRVTVKGEVLTLRERELNRIRESVLSHTQHNRGRGKAESQVVEALVRKLPDDVDVEHDEVPELIADQVSAFMDSWWPMLTPTRVLGRLVDRDLIVRLAPQFDADEASALAASYAWLNTLESDYEDDHHALSWSVADAALLDELLALLGPVPKEPEHDPLFIEGGDYAELVTMADRLRTQRADDPEDDPQTTYSHLLIDEAQDVTPMQWRMLRRRGPHASWTIVGDPAQSSYPDQAESRRALHEVVGSAPLRRFKLSTNYRSPKEVFDLAAKVIRQVYPSADLPDAIRSTDIEPVLATASSGEWQNDVREQILTLADQVEGTIGVICPPSLAGSVQRMALSDERLFALEQRLAIVTALQSKGLEYDGVLVVSPDDIVDEAPGRERVLYVALTRATQRLVTLDLTPDARWRAALD